MPSSGVRGVLPRFKSLLFERSCGDGSIGEDRRGFLEKRVLAGTQVDVGDFHSERDVIQQLIGFRSHRCPRQRWISVSASAYAGNVGYPAVVVVVIVLHNFGVTIWARCTFPGSTTLALSTPASVQRDIEVISTRYGSVFRRVLYEIVHNILVVPAFH